MFFNICISETLGDSTKKEAPESAAREALKEAARRTGAWRIVLLLSLLSLPISIASDLKKPEAEPQKTLPKASIPASVKAAGWAEAERWMKESGFGGSSNSLHFEGIYPEGNGLYLSSFCFSDSGAWREISEYIRGGEDPAPVGSPALSGASPFKEAAPSRPNLPALSVTAALQEAVSMWAAAWCSSSNEALTAEMADPNPSASFQAENLGSLKSAAILWAEEEKNGNGLAEVKVTVEKGKDSASAFNLLILIAQPTAGDPKVTDWGPTGSAAGLAPYAKAQQSGGAYQWNS